MTSRRVDGGKAAVSKHFQLSPSRHANCSSWLSVARCCVCLQVSQPSLPPVTLPGHAGEVTAVAWCPGDHCQLVTAADDATLRVWSMDRSNARYQQTYDHCNYLFADEGQQQQCLWDRLGFDRPKAPPQETGSEQQQQQQQRRQLEQSGEEAAVAGKLPAAELPGGSTGTHPAAAAGVGGKASFCSPPVTPQLPFWRSAAAADAGATPGAVAAAAAPAAGPPVAGASSEACQTPAVQKKSTVSGKLVASWQRVCSQTAIAHRKQLCAAAQRTNTCAPFRPCRHPLACHPCCNPAALSASVVAAA
jgi:hypothetical protein